MDALSIRNKVNQLASGFDNNFSYDILMQESKDRAFWAIQVALSQCYSYEFRFGSELNLNLVGNANYYLFRAQLEQVFRQFITDQFLCSNTQQLDSSKSSDEFIGYLEHLIRHHASYQHKLFEDFIPEKATKEDLRFFLAQETVPRFDDLLSLIQIGNPMQMKMELAKNYWDEMGNGNIGKAHSVLFSKTLNYFNVTPAFCLENTSLQAMVFDNVSSLLAIYRENYAHAIGFLAVTEYCVPKRFSNFIKGCQRLGIDQDVLAYHILHSEIDGDHAKGWFEQIVKPLVEKDAKIANNIVEGVVLKLNLSQYFFDGVFELLNEKNDCLVV